MYLILLGAPGVGKGTQAQRLVKAYCVPQISTGDILRSEIRNGTPLGKKVKSVMERGELVSDDLVLKIAKHRLQQPDCAKGFILDGFPRTIPQAQGLDRLLAKMEVTQLKVIDIAVPDREIIQRLTSRRICPNCGKVYSLQVNPPAVAGICDVCKHEIAPRKDDKESIIKNRLSVYRRTTAPLITFYQQKGIYQAIDGKKPVDVVTEEISRIHAAIAAAI